MATTGTEVTASGFDRRGDTLERYPVWEKKLTFVTDSGEHGEGTLAISSLNGILQKIIVVVPVTQATGKSVTVTIDDNVNNEIFNSGALAEGAPATYVFSVSEPLCGTIDVVIDFDASVGTNDHTTTIYLRGV